MRFSTASLLAALLFLPAAVAADAPPPQTVEQELTVLQQVSVALDNDKKLTKDDYVGLVAKLKAAIASDSFVQLSSNQQYRAQNMLTWAAYKTKDYTTAKRASFEACTFAEANAWDWSMRLFFDRNLDDDRDAVASLTKLIEKWPAKLKNETDQTIYDTVRRADKLPDGKTAKGKLLQALFDVQWRPNKRAAEEADSLWVDLVGFYLDGKDEAHAKAVAAVIVNPDAIATMLSEKKFDAITRTDPKRFDLDAAWVNSLARAKQRIMDYPDLLKAVIDAGITLYKLDRQSEALALLDAAQARIDKDSKSAFTDLESERNWLPDTRAWVLMALGRDEEAIRQFEGGAKLAENGDVNVSQVINLAYAYDEIGMPREALKTLKLLEIEGNSSDYGRMAYEGARAEALLQLHNDKALAESMAFIDAHGDDAPDVKLNALLRAGKLDDAARLVIARLKDPEKQSDMLAMLQINARPRLATPSLLDQDMLAKMKTLRERQDVRDAIDSIGRILTLKTLSYN